MVNVLFVEDEVNKSREIREFLKETFKNIVLYEEKSFQGAINKIREVKFSFILLDMSLPLSDDGSDFETFAGIDILEELVRLEVKSKVIVITAFDILADKNTNTSVMLNDLDKEMMRDYKEIYLGAIHYNIASVSWKEQLSNKIKDIMKEINFENING
ncbi:response regulator [Lactococcus lactis]|uniref:response regulator n=1 Tax=Lactococcus lactis TaxID=1358 RepID=UPI00165285EA|nr:hypothetical protein [Lactococcus lactis]QNL91068.1 hypothetical protein HUG14_06740 [Lactococcus lactis]